MKFKRQLRKIILAAVLFISAYLVPDIRWLQTALFCAAYLVVGLEIIKKALKNIFYGQVFDENFLMTIATVGAFALGEYSEGVAVMLFYQIGELFQSYAVNKSRKSVAGLMNIRPDYANLKTAEGIKQVSPEDVKIGEIILVKPGERIPLDGVVIAGNSLVDTSALTGESVPRELETGDEVISGGVNLNSLLEIRVTSEYAQSTVARILDLVEHASAKKAKVEQFITKFARYYTPGVVVFALIIAVFPPLLITGAVFSDWFYRALTFLVISCPCALVISVPLSFFGGIGAASRNGILVKGSNYLQALAETGVVVFDKTGTLTKGTFTVVEIISPSFPAEQLLELAAYAGFHSSHPVSNSVRRAYGQEFVPSRIKDFVEVAGQGVKAVVDGRKIAVGNQKLLTAMGLENIFAAPKGTVSFVVVDGQLAGQIIIDDEIKADSKAAVEELKKLGVDKVVMLTGDTDAAGQNIAAQVGIDNVYTQLLPAQKVEKVEELMAAKPADKRLVFVGDGINDAPVLARADIGVAMGGIGSDAAVEAADIVIMTDEPSKLATAIRISQKTLKIVKQNIVFALGVKFIVLGLGAAGMATMWEAVFADVGVSVLAILNAIRALHFKK